VITERPRSREGRTSLVSALSVGLLAAIGSGMAVTADGPSARPSSPAIASQTVAPDDPIAGTDLDVLQGAEAVEELVTTGQLRSVAAEAGLPPHELVDELLDDPSLFLSSAGDLGYVEAMPLVAPSGPERLSLPSGVNVAALNSKPTSSRTLFLDFDGHVSTDAAWSAVGAPLTNTSAPFDVDGIPGFSAHEQAIIFEVWQRVSEDYLPFDVNVTTIDPGVEALRKRGPTDAFFGQRMVITPSNFVSPGTLGVALLGTFDGPDDRAAYVFANPGPSSVKALAEAVAHEAGHTFGLSHDAQAGTSYYDGHGVWAPIMGRSIFVSKPVTQWSRGEYAGANNTQDDLRIIASYTGFRPDDHGGDSASATPVASTSTTAGFIGRTGERDVFSVHVGDGDLSVSVRPAAANWSNLLARVTVRDSAGVAVQTGEPETPWGWTAAVNATVPAGRYTIEVTPREWLTPTDGFSTYGSLGAYEMSVAAAPGATPPPAGPNLVTPIPPNRLVDTRNGIGGDRRLAAGRQVVVQVADAVTVPSGATAAVFSIAAVGPSAEGYLTAYPCSDQRPETSSVNYVAGQIVANTTIAALSSAGQLCVWTYADTDVLVDITGWLGPAGSARFSPIGPTRVVDTRSNIGGARLGPGATLAVDLNGVVPPGTTAVALNATAVGAAAPAYLTVFPCGPLPPTSTVNYAAGEARPNNTIVGLTDGRVCVYSYAATDVLIDLTGAFGPGGLSYKATAPTRVLDTRQTQPPIPPRGAVSYNVSAPALGADQPEAAFVNVTAANHRAPGYVTTYDCVTRRETSTLNQQVGQVAANGANVPLLGLESCAWLYGGGHLIVDVNGWWVR
jgi:hypothetical protein